MRLAEGRGGGDGEEVEETGHEECEESRPAQDQRAFWCAGSNAGARDYGRRGATEAVNSKGAPTARAIGCGVHQGGSAASLSPDPFPTSQFCVMPATARAPASEMPERIERLNYRPVALIQLRPPHRGHALSLRP
jgi:hypothetical protein